MTQTPESLHLLAHQAQLRARSDEDWWDNPLDTALAALNATRHPPAFREQGRRALDRVISWQRTGQARRVSADAAALALAARAAADLAVRDAVLTGAAVEAAGELAARTGRPVALHTALISWALDPVVSDRTESPWPALQASLSAASPATGLDRPLLTFAGAIASTGEDPGVLVRSMLAEAPSSPGIEDGAVVLWLLTATLERCVIGVPREDTGLRALADRRAELAMRLAQELDESAFRAPEIPDFDPEEELDLRPSVYLSPTEALLLDISLASTEPDQGWLRFEEAEDLFGERARATERRGHGMRAILLGVCGLLSGAVLAMSLVLAAQATTVWMPAGIALTCLIWVFAGAAWQAASPARAVGSLTSLAALIAVTAAVDAINQAITPHPLPDATGLIVGALAGAVALVIVTLARNPQASRSTAR